MKISESPVVCKRSKRRTVPVSIYALRSLRGALRLRWIDLARHYPPSGCSAKFIAAVVNGTKPASARVLQKVRIAFACVLAERV